jgi:hypothetical protein
MRSWKIAAAAATIPAAIALANYAHALAVYVRR